MTAKKEEKDIKELNYIKQFYDHITLLNHHYCLFENIISTQDKKTQGDPDQISSEEKQLIDKSSQELRYYVNMTRLQLKSIALLINIVIDKDFDDTHKKVTDMLIPKRDNIEKYCIMINYWLLRFIEEIQQKNPSLVQSIYAK